MASLTFDRISKLIIVDSPASAISCQEIYDEAVDYQDEPINMDLDPLVSATGKDDLGGGEATGITLVMINGWRLQFEDRPGPDTISCVVSGGNFIAINASANNPIAPSTNTQVQIRQSVAPTIVETDTSGLTATEASQLGDLHLIHGLQSGSAMVVSPSSRTAGSVTQTITKVGDEVTVTRT